MNNVPPSAVGNSFTDCSCECLQSRNAVQNLQFSSDDQINEEPEAHRRADPCTLPERNGFSPLKSEDGLNNPQIIIEAPGNTMTGTAAATITVT
ncbi:hypothetical protein CEXT_801811 [Caerostris extrusa]|uniref:Uncharacterized protein n=1 Tax=Caerostris extrusa TaxID=172846 RepID=A0AAV4R9J7_CAEEX|nr:hypothetical protein CEXT_801811 [Caerostris extrusa]